MTTLQNRVRQIEEEAAAEIAEQITIRHQDELARRSIFIAGAIAAAEKISSAISAESIRTLERFAAEKHYESLGYSTFRDFLEQSEYSPMTFHQFYDRKQILEREGDQVFDLLSGLGIPLSRRRRIGRGIVEIDGDELIIHHDDEDERIPLSDRATIMHTISSLADEVAAKRNEIEKHKRAVKAAEDAARRAYAEADEAKKVVNGDWVDEHSLALVELLGAFKKLEMAARAMTSAEKSARSATVFASIAKSYSGLRDAYGLPPLSAISNITENPSDEWDQRFDELDIAEGEELSKAL